MLLQQFLLALTVSSVQSPSPTQASRETDIFPRATAEEVGLDPKAVRALADAVEGWVKRGDAVGAVLLLVKDRRTVLSAAWGWRDREHKRAMLPDSLCNIRSMTKPFTGMAAWRLIEEGRLSLEDRIADHLPAFDREPVDRIRVEHLLSHRSGLPTVMPGKSPGEHNSLREFAATAAGQDLMFEPGESFAYSDVGTDVLGAVLEAASGLSLSRLIEKGLIEPLGLSDTFYALDAEHPRRMRVASNYAGARGRWSCFWSPEDPPMYAFAWGSQSLYSSAKDYARFLACYLDGGQVDNRAIVSPSAIERMIAPASHMMCLPSLPYPTGFADLEVHYGHMTMLFCPPEGSDITSPWAFGHGGSDGTMAWAIPEHDLIAVCFTQSRGSTKPLSLEPLLKRIVEPNAINRGALPASWAALSGSYVADFGPFRDAEFVILEQNGFLAVDLGGKGIFELESPDESGWRAARLSPQIALRFERNVDGAPKAMRFRMGAQVALLPRGEIKRRPPVVPEAVADVLGTYRDEAHAQDLRISVQDGQLVTELSIRPGPFLLLPTENKLRWSLGLNPRIVFTFRRGADGTITGYDVPIQGGGTIFRPRLED